MVCLYSKGEETTGTIQLSLTKHHTSELQWATLQPKKGTDPLRYPGLALVTTMQSPENLVCTFTKAHGIITFSRISTQNKSSTHQARRLPPWEILCALFLPVQQCTIPGKADARLRKIRYHRMLQYISVAARTIMCTFNLSFSASQNTFNLYQVLAFLSSVKGRGVTTWQLLVWWHGRKMQCQWDSCPMTAV